MTDFNTPTDETEELETEEEISSTDEKAEALSSLGIDAASATLPSSLCEQVGLTPTSFDALFAHLHSAKKAINDAESPAKKEEAETVRSKAIESIKSNLDEEVSTELRNKALAAFDTLYELVDVHGASASWLLKEMAERFSVSADKEFGWHLRNAEQEIRSASNLPADESAETARVARIQFEAVRTLIENKIAMHQYCGNCLAGKPCTTAPPEDLYIVGKGKAGGEKRSLNIKYVPRTPKIKTATGNMTSNVKMEFVVTLADQSVLSFGPGEITLSQIAHDFLSKGYVRVTQADVEASLKTQGIKSIVTKEWWTFKNSNATVQGRIAP